MSILTNTFCDQCLRLGLLDGSNAVETCFPTPPYERSRTSFQNICSLRKSHAHITSGDKRKNSPKCFSGRNSDDKSKIVAIIMLI
jgi:hypothetical protein